MIWPIYMLWIFGRMMGYVYSVAYSVALAKEASK